LQHKSKLRYQADLPTAMPIAHLIAVQCIGNKETTRLLISVWTECNHNDKTRKPS